MGNSQMPKELLRCRDKKGYAVDSTSERSSSGRFSMRNGTICLISDGRSISSSNTPGCRSSTSFQEIVSLNLSP